MFDLWFLVKGAAASLFPLELREVLKGPLLHRADRVEIVRRIGVREDGAVGGWS